MQKRGKIRILKEILGNKPRNLSNIESAWLAGVIDGEGSIGLYDYGKEGRRVCIQVANTNKDFVDKVKKIIGCGSSVTRESFHRSHKGRKPIYHFTLKGSARCYAVLKKIESYLIIKKGLARKIIKEIEEKPFGRWKNCTAESRKKLSNLTKESWKDPVIRLKRITGMKAFFKTVVES